MPSSLERPALPAVIGALCTSLRELAWVLFPKFCFKNVVCVVAVVSFVCSGMAIGDY